MNIRNQSLGSSLSLADFLYKRAHSRRRNPRNNVTFAQFQKCVPRQYKGLQFQNFPQGKMSLLAYECLHVPMARNTEPACALSTLDLKYGLPTPTRFPSVLPSCLQRLRHIVERNSCGSQRVSRKRRPETGDLENGDPQIFSQRFRQFDS